MDLLYIPKKINVGYQERKDTYTKKLAYVIYYDHTGKLRKETSWQNWRDSKLEPNEFENIPTEGFVLNKSGGGAREGRYDWNPRNEFIRVYDPRGFEFEISLPNLLFILQECTSVKGKGLDGSFVYSWFGSDLILLPTNCQAYKKNIEYTELQSKKISTKDLTPGCIYKTNKNEEVVYIGKEDHFEWKYYEDVPLKYRLVDIGVRTIKVPIKKHIFQYLNTLTESNCKYYPEQDYLFLTSLNRIKEKISDSPIENYAEIFDKYKCQYFGFNATKYKIDPIDLSKLEKDADGAYSRISFALEVAPGKIDLYRERVEHRWNKDNKYAPKKYLTLLDSVSISAFGEAKRQDSQNRIYNYDLKNYGILKVLSPRNEYKEYRS